MAVRFIARTNDCWLRVQLEGGPIGSVPYGLKVTQPEIRAGREYFEILEGVNKSRQASIANRPGQSYLTDRLAHGPAAIVRLNRQTQTLHVGSRGPFNAFSGGGHAGYPPVPAGSHLLAIPAYPSAQTRSAYSTWTKYHNLWFRIGTSLSGSRFLHPGAISDGCVTVRQFVYDPASGSAPPPGFGDLVRGASTAPGLLGLPLPATRAPTIGWDDIVEALILSRLDDQAVGRLVVT
jgi:hypothetical protein